MNSGLPITVCVLLLTGGISAAENGSPFWKTFLEQHCLKCHGEEKQEADLRFDALTDLSPGERRTRWQDIRRKIVDREMPPQDSPQPPSEERHQLLAWIAETHGDAPSTKNHWSFQPVVRPEIPLTAGEQPNAIDAFVGSRLAEHHLTASPTADRRTLIRRVTLDLIGLPPTPEEVQAFLDDRSELDAAFKRVADRLLRSPRYGERWAQHWLDVIRWAETVGFETNLERPHAWHYRDWVIDSLNKDKPYDQFIFEQLAGDTVSEDAALGFLVAGPANLPGQIGRDEEAMRQARQDELDEVIRTVSQSLFGLTISCARCHDHKFDPLTQHDYYALQAVFAGLSYGHRRLRGTQDDKWTKMVPRVQAELRQLQRELEQTRVRFGLRQAVESVQTETFESKVVDAVRMEIEATDAGTASLYEFEVWSTAQDGSPSRNVALASHGARPSASSFALANQTRHFDNLVDGSIDKRQAFPWVAVESGPAWLEIGLPRAVRVNRVVWYAGSSTPASYEIKVRHAQTRQWRTVAHTRDRLPRISDKRAAKDVQVDGMSDDEIAKLCRLFARIRNKQNELTRLSNGPQVYAANFTSSPAATWLLKRGDPMQRVREVVPAVPAALQQKATVSTAPPEPDRRLALARHLTSPDHPLTARVIANRIWQHHFGVGLVETPSDFGKMGAPPSHPRLLDWLAAEFVSQGWSLKKLHRIIVTSQTYKQSNRPNTAALAVDAQARLLWRYPPRRLDAEAIRDSILAVSGKLNLKMYGSGFDFFDLRGGLSDYTAKQTFDSNGWRRMIYAHKIRMQAVDIFGAFDCPDAGQMTPRRNQSITPIQSLGLFNSPFVNRQAKFFAERIQAGTKDLFQQIDRVFQLALARAPTPNESDRMIELARHHGLDQACRVILNSSEFVFIR